MTFPVPSMLEAKARLPLFVVTSETKAFYSRVLEGWAEVGDQFLLIETLPTHNRNEYMLRMLSNTGKQYMLFHWSDSSIFTATFDGVVRDDDYERFKVTPV